MNAHTPRAFDGPVGDLLLVTAPLLRVMRGERRENFRRAWINVALGMASTVMDIDEGRLPDSPRNAARALLRAVLELCDRLGIEGPELVGDFNQRRERGEYARPGNPEESMERCHALLAVLYARRMGGET